MGYNLYAMCLISLSTLLINESFGMECYVCTTQEGNKDKCLSTVKTCDYGEDTCLTELRWGSTPYWSQGAEKQYYVTKRCSTKEYCENLRKNFTPYCHRIWYEDWKCGECCLGDRCNYYIIMGAKNVKSSIGVIFAAVSILPLIRFLSI